jgi:hypothetical protein
VIDVKNLIALANIEKPADVKDLIALTNVKKLVKVINVEELAEKQT